MVMVPFIMGGEGGHIEAAGRMWFLLGPALDPSMRAGGDHKGVAPGMC